MEIVGTQAIAASRQRVWDALNDPEILKQCVPGCESVERTSPESFKAIAAVAIGPMRARFNGTLRLSDIDAPQSCTLSFEGQGGAIGFAKGSSAIQLTEKDGQTEMSYTAKAQVGGKLAQVGSRLIDNAARKMADDFFKAFNAQLVGAPASEQTETPVPKAKAASPSEPIGIMVPAWWLVVAAALGAAVTFALLR